MKFKYKKYLLILSDVTNLLLKKDFARESDELKRTIHNLRFFLLLTNIMLMISIVINIFLVVKQ